MLHSPCKMAIGFSRPPESTAFLPLRIKLLKVWPNLSGPLLAANDEREVTDAFEKYAEPYSSNFVPRFATDILALTHDPLFPKRAKAQVRFLADFLAGRPELTARLSRDICAEERQHERAKSPYRILRKEFYVECTCGYEGPAFNDACRKCGAAISIAIQLL